MTPDKPYDPVAAKVTSLTNLKARAAEVLADRWVKGAVLGKNVQWYCDDYPDWYIYEQAAGFFVWLEFQFRSRHDTFAEAIAVVEATS